MEYTRISEGVNTPSFINDIFGIGSHSKKHDDVPIQDVLNRFLTSEIKANSKFTNVNGTDFLIEEALFMKEKVIDEWLYETKKPTLTVHVVLPSEEYDGYIGKGYKKDVKGHIAEYETDTITCSLRRSYKSKYGFYLTTAYPDITVKTAVKTNRDITKILETTNAYQDASSVKKAYMKWQVNDASLEFNVWYGQNRNVMREGQSDDYICVEERIGNTSKFNRVTITEDDMILSTFEKPDKHNELKKPHKIFSDIVEVIKPMLSDGEKPKLENSLLKGGNHAAFKSLHGKMCTVVDTIFNNIRSESGKPQLDMTKITEMKQDAAYLSKTKQDDKGKTIV